MSIDILRSQMIVRHYLSLIKFAHTVFALPFALIGFVVGLQDVPPQHPWRLLFLVLLCMIFARSAAMAFNRYADHLIDARNARTRVREIPSGVISARAVLWFTVISALAFVLTTWFINPLCFWLSPVALTVVLGYSYTKRFTAFSHFVLGAGLALAPVGAYLAVTAHFSLVPILLGCIVLLWVGGFDIIYAMQDESFDRDHQLHSVPVWLGAQKALWLSTMSHALCAVLLVIVIVTLSHRYPEPGLMLYCGGAVFLVMLWYQHRIVSATDLSRVNAAFFTSNGVASLVLGMSCILDFYL